MLKVTHLVFRKITDADFFNINKPIGTETLGGGQSYIDFPTSAISIINWKKFFNGIPTFHGKNGPRWKFKLKSLGVNKTSQEITIAQRRPASVSIRSQKIHSTQSNRVFAWRQDLTGFPKPKDPSKRNRIYDLHIYIAKLENGEYWAGWFQTSKPELDWSINGTINKMFTENEGYLEFHGDVMFDTSDSIWPFRISKIKSARIEPVLPVVIPGNEDSKIKILFDEDEINVQNKPPKVKELVRKVRVRNSKAVKKLKKLYNNLCQISGKKYTFKKTNGEYYSEAHHLIPLGKGGADSIYNIVILSPLIHRMLHYAKIEDLNLQNIKNNRLAIKINGTKFIIKWHPDHAKIIRTSS